MNPQEVLVYFSKWIEKESGIIYEDHNLYQLQDRLDQLVRHFDLKSSVDLWQRAQTGITGEFRQMLIDISTNNETSFFRDKKFFDCLEKTIIPSLISKNRSLSDLNIWSVASSTGQEPYSVAMILAEMSKKLSQPAPRILATDISQKVLAKAAAGKYTDLEMGRGLNDNLRQTYFRPETNNNWILANQIRGMVDFQALNLRTPFNMGKQFDLILCRNVLIYQRVDAKTEIVNRITTHLRPDGVFLMGSAESLIGISTAYQQNFSEGVAIYKLKKLEQKLAS